MVLSEESEQRPTIINEDQAYTRLVELLPNHYISCNFGYLSSSTDPKLIGFCVRAPTTDSLFEEYNCSKFLNLLITHLNNVYFVELEVLQSQHLQNILNAMPFNTCGYCNIVDEYSYICHQCGTVQCYDCTTQIEQCHNCFETYIQEPFY